ncbi:MAG: hypothetical protein PUC06_02860 [Oscillospiraceae bacterium]|nr:hypothetical protein [Oscillospiraceae bacterium]
MEQQFLSQWEKCRKMAAEAGVRMRPVDAGEAMKTAHRLLSGSRTSDGFSDLVRIGHTEWSLEALAVDKRFTGLFSDEEANEALARLMEVGYFSCAHRF